MRISRTTRLENTLSAPHKIFNSQHTTAPLKKKKKIVRCPHSYVCTQHRVALSDKPLLLLWHLLVFYLTVDSILSSSSFVEVPRSISTRCNGDTDKRLASASHITAKKCISSTCLGQVLRSLLSRFTSPRIHHYGLQKLFCYGMSRDYNTCWRKSYSK